MPTLKVPQHYKRHIEKSFERISKHDYVRTQHPEIQRSAENILDHLRNFRDDSTWSFKIAPPWEIELLSTENPVGLSTSLMLSGQVSVEKSEFKMYSFAMCIAASSRAPSDSSRQTNGTSKSCCEKVTGSQAQKRIARRFHFDMDTGVAEENRPIFHLQFGGEAGELKPMRSDHHYCLDDGIEKPRFPFPPLDIVLLLDLVITQYKTDFARAFEDVHWLGFVRNSERLLLKKYYDRIQWYLDKGSNTTLHKMLCDRTHEWI